jgi:hypothetical protein
MTWTRLCFGKYSELSLPRLIVVDPDWFFWAVGERIILITTGFPV